MPPRHEQPIFPIPDDATPEDTWRRADYEPGDLLMMQMSMPHTAINNHSDRFRLSMDIRMVLDRANAPAMGAIEELDTQHIVLRDVDGTLRSFVVDESTYCRGGTQDRLFVEQMVAQFKIGDLVIVPAKDGVATVIRPQH